MVNIYKRCILLVAAACLAATSCTTDEALTHAPGKPAEDMDVRLTINTPPAAIPKAPTTKSQTAQESEISEIRVLVFKNDRYDYSADGVINSQSETSTTFNALLKSSSTPVTLWLVANSNEAIDGSGIQYNDTKAAVKQKLLLAHANSGMEYPFPMYGEHEAASLTPEGDNNISGIKMLRAIARADVLVDEAAANFELVSVQLFRANSLIQIIPNAMLQASVTSPSVPEGSAASVNTTSMTTTGNRSESQLYVPESEAPAEGGRNSEATCIVVGGKFDGSPTPTYYRIDFNPGISGHPSGQILRNHKYIFNIKKVGVPGEPTPEEAADKVSAGIIAEVQTWDESTTDMWYEGDYFFGVSRRTVALRPWANMYSQKETIAINTNLGAYSIQWSDASGEPRSGSSPSATSITDDYFTVSLADGTLTVGALTHNRNTADLNDYFVILAGRWKIVITITQYGGLSMRGRNINLLSFYGIGDLGEGGPTDETSADGLAMRRLLNRNFSPGGTFDFGGYHFAERAAIVAATDISATTLALYDVISMNYVQYPSVTLANRIKEWLEAKPNRVLIITTDNQANNENVRKAIGDNLTWSFAGASTPFTVVRDESTKLFTDGPFGAVATGTQFAFADATWGRAANNDPNVTDVLTTNSGAMVMGINKSKRVVYMGESQLFLNRGITNALSANGDLSRNHDLFMANVWGWITETVLAGCN